MMLFWPVFLPLLTIVLLLFCRRRLNWQYAVSLSSALAQIIAAFSVLQIVHAKGIITAQAGGWPAPFGITFVADMTSALLLMAVSLVALVSLIYSIGFIDRGRQLGGIFILFQGLLMGVNGAFLTGDIFNLYVWFEVMIISSFVLITFGSENQQLRASVKYLVMNLIGSAFFVAAIGLLYGQLGTLNMADIALKIQSAEVPPLFKSTMMLFFIAFGIKAAVFPFFFWLPASYPTPPIAVTAFFGATLTKVGIYVILRFYSLFGQVEGAFWQPIFFWIAGLTMVFGVLMAASAYDIRKILSFHIISQIGYMVMGIALFSVMGLAGALFFVIHNIFSKTAAFMAGGLIYIHKGSYDLKKIGWIYKSKPLLTFLFLIPALSLAGLPPTPGFWGKLFLILAAFEGRHWAIAATAVLVSLLTLFSMIKIWNEAMWKPDANGEFASVSVPAPALVWWAAALITLLVLILGLFIGPLYPFFEKAALQLLEPDFYIQAVLAGSGR
jgi:multicomponent Na+:H+ antiporter subunit D